jgi:ABC-type nitrate/sulfonate/bicarbonate transport system substrate-binding protein
MITLHTGYQPSTYEGLDAKLIAGVETRGDVLVVSSDIVDKYKELQSLKDVTIATHPIVSTPHTILSEWLLDNGIDLKTDVDIKIIKVDKKRLK